MKRTVLSLLITIFVVTTAFSQNKEALAKSDSLFALGVELYNAGNYEEAIPIFIESDKIDKAELDSTSDRRDYSAMWLASCYYKLGNEEEAKDCYKNYKLQPVDRRLTVASDSLATLGTEFYKNGNYEEALSYYSQCAEIEKSVVGEESYWYANSSNMIALSNYSLGNYTEAITIGTKVVELFKKILSEEHPDYIIALRNLADYYGGNGNYDEMIRLATEALSIFERAVEKDNSDYAATLNCLALYNSYKGNYSEAIRIGTQALDVYKEFYGEDNSNYATLLSNLADYHAGDGNYDEAIRLKTEELEIQEKILGKENSDYANILSKLASYNSSLGNYTEAIRLETEVLEIQERVSGKDNPTYSTSLDNLAYYNASMGDYSEAIKFQTEELEICEKTQGKENSDYTDNLSWLAEYYYKSGNLTEAIRLGTETLEICEKTQGTENSDYAGFLNSLARYYSDSGNYTEAIRLDTEALNIRGRVLGKDHPNYAISLNNLANDNNLLGNNTDAIRLGTEALEIYKKTIGKENFNYATILGNLADYVSASGNYTEAIRLITETLDIFEKTVGKEHPYYANSLNKLALYNASIGNYTEAIRLDTDVLKIRERAFGKNHPDYAKSLNLIALHNYYICNYTEAIRLGTEALEIQERILGRYDYDYATSLNNLALYNLDIGNYSESLHFITEALEIKEKILGKYNSSYAMSLINLAGYYYYTRDYNEAIRIQKETLEIQERVLGKNHPDCAMSLHNIAVSNSKLGNYSEAIYFETNALKIRETTIGKKHPYYAMSLDELAGYSFHDGQLSETTDYAIKATQTYDEIIHNTFADMTANERVLFWNQYSKWYESTLPEYAFYIQDDSLTSTTYDGTLLSKGLLLNSEIEMSKLLTESGDTAVVAKYEELKSNRALFNKMVENRYADLQAITDTVARAEYKAQLDAKIDSLERRLQMREHELVQESKAYGDYTKNLSIGWREVQDKLGNKDVAIEFLNFAVLNDSVMYAALTLTKDDDVPHLIPLFEKSELDSISKYDYYNSLELADLVWKPLSEVLADKENIYFAPAGNLHNIAIESIPCYDGDGLMSDKWNLYRLSSTRELALIKDKNEIKDAYLYGNLKYDTNMETLVADAGNYTGIDRSVDWETVNIADSLDLRGSAQSLLNSLPATKEEVESIDHSLKSRNINSTLLTDTIGTESSFKALTGQRPSVLHIATHGFYWTESEAKKIDLASMAMLNDDSSNKKYVEDKALTRSGLFFAGAANALKKDTKIPEGVDDGILTAKEISVLDLRGLDLVVLSACETGLGEITGDGVFGLQRGFKKAGAQTLLMSLWKVDDNATQMLMSQFYTNLTKGENKFTALKDAQSYVRMFDNGKYSDPKYWAAFILLDAID